MNLQSIIFIGTSDYAVPALRALHATEGFAPKLVITQPDRPQGRKLKLTPTPVAQLSESLGIPTIKPEDINSDLVYETIRAYNPDLLITASYGALIGRRLRQLASLGAINLHPSLLPLYRGASPIQSALIRGDSRTGITIFKLSARMDAGDIYLQQEEEIYPGDNFSSLHDRLAQRSADLLIRLLKDMKAGQVSATKQDHNLATYTRKIEKEDLEIGWANPAEGIWNQIRALSETPGAATTYNGTPLKILAAEILEEPFVAEPGTVVKVITNLGFCVAASDKQLLIRTVKAAGKKALSAAAWQIGSRIKPGDRFGTKI